MARRRAALACASVMIGVAFTACVGEPDDTSSGATEATAAGALPPGHMSVTQEPPGSAVATMMSATVLETMNSGGYTYARVDSEDGEIWMAGPETTVDVGGTVMFVDATPMENFTSGSLSRTFDVLYFVGAYLSEADMAAIEVASAPPVDGVQAPVLEVLTGGGYTYVQVDAEDGQRWLAGPSVEVATGQTVAWRGGSTMSGFRSNTLDRTFDEIVFVEQLFIVR